MKKWLYIFFASITGLLPLSVYCQSSAIEKAKQDIYQASSDRERLNALVAIGKLRNSLHGDTIYHYAQLAKKLALQLKDNRSLAWAEYSLISSDLAKGTLDSVIQKIDASATFAGIKKTDAALYYKVQLLKANALNRLNNRTGALELQLKLLGEAEKEGNINAQLFALNFIGATYLNVGKLTEAKKTWLHGMQIIEENNIPENREIEAYILSNLALIYYNKYYTNPAKEARDSFLTTINSAIDLSKKDEYLGVLASALPVRGNFYGLLNEFAKAETDFKAGVDVRKKVGDPFYIVSDLSSLCNFYFTKKQYEKCIETSREGISIANTHGIMGEQLPLIGLMGLAYKSSGDYKQYSITLEQYIKAADSSNKVNAADKIADIETKYEVQKKETLIAQQKLDLLKRNILLYSGVFSTVVLLGFLAYRFKKYQGQQKMLAEEKKRQSEAAVKEAEEKERKRIAAELHDNLGVQANAILHNSTLLTEGNANNKDIAASLQETAKEMMLNLRETLWAMKSTDVPAADLWLRIISFMKQMGRHYTSLQFVIEGEAPKEIIVPSNKALNMVLVLQETVNNAVKHAEASTITASSSFSNNEWVISIQDNGKGFDMNAAKEKKDAYGLSNMMERAAAGSFGYHIETVPGNGAKAAISVGF
jgi:two-component system, NarL family, sensor kinase